MRPQGIMISPRSSYSMGNVTHHPLKVEKGRLVRINTFNKNFLLVLIKQLLGVSVEVQSFKC